MSYITGPLSPLNDSHEKLVYARVTSENLSAKFKVPIEREMENGDVRSEVQHKKTSLHRVEAFTPSSDQSYVN